MHLLQASAWGDFPTWVQAITGLIALIIAGITLFHSFKIKELVDIVKALKEQTEELAKQTEINRGRFELEFENSLYASIPFFVPVSHFGNIGELKILNIQLQNKGTTAHRVRIEKSMPTNFDFQNRNYHAVDHNASINFDLLIYFSEMVKYDMKEVHLKLFFYDDRNRHFSQSVTYEIPKKNLFLTPPAFQTIII